MNTSKNSRCLLGGYAPKTRAGCYKMRDNAMGRAHLWKLRGDMELCAASVRQAWQWHYAGRTRQ
jgi:hypothetical protein